MKMLNTTNALVMVNPTAVANGDHSMFVCGNDTAAKASVKQWVALGTPMFNFKIAR